MSEIQGRFKDNEWVLSNLPVMIVGLGGIGSWVALPLSRCGYALTLYDMDIVETSNIGGQFYSKNDVDKSKTQATVEKATMFGDNYASSTFGEYTQEEGISAEIVISCVDSIKVRRIIFEKWVKYQEAVYTTDSDYELHKNLPAKTGIFIDGRMEAEGYQVYAVPYGDYTAIEKYRATLFDEDVEYIPAPCTNRATTHCAMKVAAEIVEKLVNYLTNQVRGFNMRAVPFSVLYDMKVSTKYD
jgi:molybdopterin/thiamine biosynthesis adenylyltransferase